MRDPNGINCCFSCASKPLQSPGRPTLNWLGCPAEPVGENRGLVGKLLPGSGKLPLSCPSLLGCLLRGVLACTCWPVTPADVQAWTPGQQHVMR